MLLLSLSALILFFCSVHCRVASQIHSSVSLPISSKLDCPSVTGRRGMEFLCCNDATFLLEMGQIVGSIRLRPVECVPVDRVSVHRSAIRIVLFGAPFVVAVLGALILIVVSAYFFWLYQRPRIQGSFQAYPLSELDVPAVLVEENVYSEPFEV